MNTSNLDNTLDTIQKALLRNSGDLKVVVVFSIVAVFILVLLFVKLIYNISFFGTLTKLFYAIGQALGKFVNKRERRYQRDVKIGKIDAKRKSVMAYRFLNDLVIDLGLKQKGSTPYSFAVAVGCVSLIIAFILAEVMFGNLGIIIILFPLMFALILCGLYTKANVAHDTRIEAILESENIISNSIKLGVVAAVRNSIDLMPKVVRPDFRDFLDNVEQKNYHIRTALMELNNNLGTIADDFIKKCIEFETSEEHGIADMFKDVVEINNVKLETRIIMKRKFEEVVQEFLLGSTMILMFLAFILVGYEYVRELYFKTFIGQLVICADILIFTGEFVYITYLRARNM